MAHDLILGSTHRDWSCGNLVDGRQGSDRPWAGPQDAGKLGEAARSEIAQSASLAVRLSRSGRLPQADKDQFSRFHRRWTDLYSSRRGKFGQRDVLALWNFREANRKLGARLSAFEKIAQTPARAPEGALAVGAPAAAPPAPPTWALLVGAALALFGVGVFKVAKPS